MKLNVLEANKVVYKYNIFRSGNAIEQPVTSSGEEVDRQGGGGGMN